MFSQLFAEFRHAMLIILTVFFILIVCTLVSNAQEIPTKDTDLIVLYTSGNKGTLMKPYSPIEYSIVKKLNKPSLLEDRPESKIVPINPYKFNNRVSLLSGLAFNGKAFEAVTAMMYSRNVWKQWNFDMLGMSNGTILGGISYGW